MHSTFRLFLFAASILGCMLTFSSCNEELFPVNPVVPDIEFGNGSNDNGSLPTCDRVRVRVQTSGDELVAVLTPASASEEATYLWSNGETGERIAPAETGVYTVTVTVDGSCVATGRRFFRATSFDECRTFGVLARQVRDELTARVRGNSEGLAYEWSTGETTSSITPTEDGEYSVTVTNAAGCTASDVANFTSPGGGGGGNPGTCSVGLSVNATNTATHGIMSATPLSGTPPYTYLWSNGFTGQTQEIAREDLESTYTVTVTDAAGCTGSGRVGF